MTGMRSDEVGFDDEEGRGEVLAALSPNSENFGVGEGATEEADIVEATVEFAVEREVLPEADSVAEASKLKALDTEGWPSL